MRVLVSILIFVSAASVGVVSATEKSNMTKEMKILKPASLPSSLGPTETFTGTVHVTPLTQGEEPSCLTCASVGFEPGARSAWHSHPKGQLLVVTNGAGLIQEWGKPVRRIQKGDVIWTPPGVKHWHGAAPNSALTHTAIQESLNGKVVEWMDKVTDAEYRTTPR
jgi:quercetin dioxygenase-like cupin family protein